MTDDRSGALCGRCGGYLSTITRSERRVSGAAGEDAADVLDDAMDVMTTGESHARDGMLIRVLQRSTGRDVLQKRPASGAGDAYRKPDERCHR